MRTFLLAVMAASSALAQDGVLPVRVENVAGTGRFLDLRLELRDGQVVAGVGRASFTRSPAELDVTGLSVADGQVAGELKVNLVSDGYAAATNFTCKIEAPLAVDKFLPRPLPNGVARLTMNCENVVTQVAKKGGGRRLVIELATRDGKAFAARAVPTGSMTDVAFATRATRCTVTSVDGKLAGEIEVALTQQSGDLKPILYVYTLDGRIVGDMATGRIATKCDGKDAGETGTFVASVRQGSAPAPGNALYKLTIHEALGAGKFVDLYLSTKDGKFTHGFGTSPNFNNATHEVDVTKLKLEGHKITGDVPVTVLPDPWIPKDHKPIACLFSVAAILEDGEVTGTAGQFALEGRIDAKPTNTALAGGAVKLEAGLMGDAGYRSRAFVAFTAKDGKVTGGKVGNNHTKLAGTVDGGEIKIENEHLVGNIRATVTVGDGSTEGKYEFEINSLLVGTAGAGAFTTHFGERTKTGRLWAIVKLE